MDCWECGGCTAAHPAWERVYTRARVERQAPPRDAGAVAAGVPAWDVAVVAPASWVGVRDVARADADEEPAVVAAGPVVTASVAAPSLGVADALAGPDVELAVVSAGRRFQRRFQYCCKYDVSTDWFTRIARSLCSDATIVFIAFVCSSAASLGSILASGGCCRERTSARGACTHSSRGGAERSEEAGTVGEDHEGCNVHNVHNGSARTRDAYAHACVYMSCMPCAGCPRAQMPPARGARPAARTPCHAMPATCLPQGSAVCGIRRQTHRRGLRGPGSCCGAQVCPAPPPRPWAAHTQSTRERAHRRVAQGPTKQPPLRQHPDTERVRDTATCAQALLCPRRLCTGAKGWRHAVCRSASHHGTRART